MSELEASAAPVAPVPEGGLGGEFAALFTASVAEHKFREGGDVQARISRVGRDYVVADAGLKSESYIPATEFHNDAGEVDVAEGDVVEVELELLDNGRGDTALSRVNYKRKRAWRMLEKAFEEDGTIAGEIRDRVKGGFTVNVDGLRGFLPGSLVDIFPVKDGAALLGEKMEFKIIKLEARRNSIVLSRKAVIERAMMSRKREDVLADFNEGETIKGAVRGVVDYGAFVDLGAGLYGLLHITDLAWRRVKNVTDVVNVGDMVEVKILKVDREKARISLGLKQLQEDPWEHLEKTYPPQTRFFGRVSNITEYGAFVEIEPGIEGLVHASEMDWTRKNVHPASVVKVGDEVEAMMLEVDKDRRRISLGMKQCRPNPWQEFAAAYRKGSVVTGKVRTITEFGMFMQLPGDIDGLVHIGDLSYTERGEDALRRYQKGAEVKSMVLAIDAERERIGLGIKQMADAAFDAYAAEHGKGVMTRGTVVEVGENGALLQLAPGVVGFLPASETAESKVDDIGAAFKVGDQMELMIITMDRRSHQITLSLKARDRAEREEAMRKFKDEPQGGGTTSLGELLRAKLEDKDSPAADSDSDSGSAAEKPAASAAAESDQAGAESAAEAAQTPAAAESGETADGGGEAAGGESVERGAVESSPKAS